MTLSPPSPLFQAIQSASFEALDALLATPEGQAAARSERSTDGHTHTLLERAIVLRSLPLARKALPWSASREGNAAGLTPLMLAAYEGFEPMLSLLLPLSDPMARSNRGMTALMCACASGRDETCARILLPVSDPLAMDNRGDCALRYAAISGSLDCARLLMPRSGFNHWAPARQDKLISDTRMEGFEGIAEFLQGARLSSRETHEIRESAQAPLPSAAPKKRL